MKILFLYIYLTIGTVVGVFAQSPTSTPVPQTTSNPSEIIRQQALEQQRQQERIRNTRLSGSVNRANGANYNDLLLLYRKTTKIELQLLAPKPEDLKKYDNFLRQPNTGIIKLAADKGCSENTNIVVATPDCLAYTMPGAGSSYSFRVGNYRIPRLADITFTNNSFQATGILLNGFLVKIGDLPLEQVNLQTKGLKFITDVKAEPDFQKAKELDLQLIEGITANGFLYRRAVEAEVNMTYVLRSIAYRGEYFRAVQKVTYNELEFDKRNDVIVAFRVIRRDEDGAVTIIWKQLAKQNSPKIKRNRDAQVDKNSSFTARKINEH